MSLDPKLISTIPIAVLVVWGLVRRLRRTFGRQPVQPARIWLRIGVLTLACGLVVATSAVHGVPALEALSAGLASGIALAYVGLRHTRFEVTPEGRFYTPHTYIGLVVTLLLVGRLLYRFLYLSSGANGSPPGSPLTLGIFAVLIGYYLVFYAGVLLRTRAELPVPDPLSPE